MKRWMIVLIVSILLIGVCIAFFSEGNTNRLKYQLTKNRIEQLMKRGYTEEDIRTAYALSFDTDCSMEVLLIQKKNTGSWELVVNYLSSVGTYHKPPILSVGKKLSPLSLEQRKLFFKARISFDEMDKAYQDMNNYDVKPEEIIKLKQEYTTWENIRLVLGREYKHRPDRYLEISVPPGMTIEEVKAKLLQGYSPEQIMEVDRQVRSTGLYPNEFIKKMQPKEKNKQG